ncbi:MAG TPA: creatininase family protein [Acidobacteriota bacterium]|nr:creatininase family protein [Acidobacteriota bacterium]
MERHLHKLNWLTVRDLVPDKVDTVIFPVGTVEAHGTACLGTDNLIPETIADGIARRLNALIAPTVNYGVTRSLYRYNGSCTVKPSTLQLYVREVLDSFSDIGFRHVILMNGHGGNNDALKTVAHDFHRERACNIAVIHWWELCADMTREFFGHRGGHAGTDESAMVQAVDPDLIDRDAYDPDLAWYFRDGADVYPVPGTILLYKEGEGYPEFDVPKARAYREEVIEHVGQFAEMVVTRWRKYIP